MLRTERDSSLGEKTGAADGMNSVVLNVIREVEMLEDGVEWWLDVKEVRCKNVRWCVGMDVDVT